MYDESELLRGNTTTLVLAVLSEGARHAYAIGGTGNHLHALVGVPPIVCASEAVQKLKANSSRWLRTNGKWPGWQEGYGAFSVSSSHIEAVRHYIQNQEQHHRGQTYEDEFVSFLERSGTHFDRNHIFD